MGIAIACAMVVGAAPPAAAEPRGPVRITRFLGEQRLPHLMRFAGTTVGGISGFDRDPRDGTWYFISDDRWRYDPARFYTGRLAFDRVTGALKRVRISGVRTLTRPDGKPYPAYGKPGSADPESIRFDRWRGRLVWGDEGDRPDERNPNIPISHSAVRAVGLDGRFQGELGLPWNLRLTDENRGPRRNFGFEGVAVSQHAVTAVTEGPRFEDGALPTVYRGSVARVTMWDRQGRPRGQYAYHLDRLSVPPSPPTGLADSGVSELLAIDDFRYLALERSWIQGVGYRVKLYEIDLRGATNVIGRDYLERGGPYRPVAKRLVADLGGFRPPVQNLEGMAWGPRLASGECTLVIGSDDNFAKEEVTTFMAFGATGCP
ncbi:esterase-like activity of phytase family protein [Nonomuraea candida]|uniref:esterase-like activity of phytase family protein n=1 Tax=Nonomuraea candida TaxID=359159 RepID=UPI000694AD20|nr:esterase-like activity of phytase family protein [Nonomuraea candida]